VTVFFPRFGDLNTNYTFSHLLEEPLIHCSATVLKCTVKDQRMSFLLLFLLWLMFMKGAGCCLWLMVGSGCSIVDYSTEGITT